MDLVVMEMPFILILHLHWMTSLEKNIEESLLEQFKTVAKDVSKDLFFEKFQRNGWHCRRISRWRNKNVTFCAMCY